MIEFDPHREVLSGPAGELPVAADDQVTRKLAMLLEGHCNGLGATAAARKYGYSKQRYYQLLKAYRQGGGAALESAKRGPKTNYRRTPQLVRVAVRQQLSQVLLLGDLAGVVRLVRHLQIRHGGP